MNEVTPRKIDIEPENDGLVQMIFLFQGARILRFHVNLPRCKWKSNRCLFSLCDPVRQQFSRCQDLGDLQIFPDEPCTHQTHPLPRPFPMQILMG